MRLALFCVPMAHTICSMLCFMHPWHFALDSLLLAIFVCLLLSYQNVCSNQLLCVQPQARQAVVTRKLPDSWRLNVDTARCACVLMCCVSHLLCMHDIMYFVSKACQALPPLTLNCRLKLLSPIQGGDRVDRADSECECT